MAINALAAATFIAIFAGGNPRLVGTLWILGLTVLCVAVLNLAPDAERAGDP